MNILKGVAGVTIVLVVALVSLSTCALPVVAVGAALKFIVG